MIRLRYNFLSGTTTSSLSSGTTTLDSAELANVPVVTNGVNYIPLVLDPTGSGGVPEIVYITAHSSMSTSATISRGQEGTTARSHSSGISWTHGPLVDDYLVVGAPNIDDLSSWSHKTILSSEEFNRSGSNSSLPSGASWINQGSSTFNEEFGRGTVAVAAKSSTYDHRGVVVSLPGSGDWVATLKASGMADSGSDTYPGSLALVQSSNGKMILVSPYLDGTSKVNRIYVDYWNSATSYGSAITNFYIKGSSSYSPIGEYFRVIKSGTTYTFQVGNTGTAWVTCYSGNITGTLTPDQIGFIASVTTAGQIAIDWIRVTS